VTKRLLLKEVYAHELSLDESRRHINMPAFKKMDQRQRHTYLRKFGRMLGTGSAREVYLIGSGTVLKWAKNEKGNSQNEAEVEIFTDPKMKPLVAKIYDFDVENYAWLVSELVRPIEKPEEFEKLTGIQDLSRWVAYVETLAKEPDKRQAYHQELIEDYDEEYGDLPLTKYLVDALRDTSLWSPDLTIIDHWGETADGRVVILDYGYTKDVRLKHYA